MPEELTTTSTLHQSLEEKRGGDMWLDRITGYSDEDIAIRHGVCPSEVDGLIQAAIMTALMKKNHVVVQMQALDALTRNQQELLRLDKVLPDFGIGWKEELTKSGDKKLLRQLVSNVSMKARLRQEIRQTVLATKAMLNTDPGEIPQEERKREIGEVMGVMRDVVREGIEKMRQEARANGQLQEKLKQTKIIDAESM